MRAVEDTAGVVIEEHNEEGMGEEDEKRELVGWMRQCSKHLSHIEGRMMEGALLGHEVVRQMLMFWTSFVPYPMGDWGWVLRKAMDIGVRALRYLVKTYNNAGQIEDMVVFCLRATSIVRLYYEESFVRALSSVQGNSEDQKNEEERTLQPRGHPAQH